MVTVTKGSTGSKLHPNAGHINIPPVPATLVHSNGAGDAFAVALRHAKTAGDVAPKGGLFAATAAYAIGSHTLCPLDVTAQPITGRLR